MSCSPTLCSFLVAFIALNFELYNYLHLRTYCDVSLG